MPANFTKCWLQPACTTFPRALLLAKQEWTPHNDEGGDRAKAHDKSQRHEASRHRKFRGRCRGLGTQVQLIDRERKKRGAVAPEAEKRLTAEDSAGEQHPRPEANAHEPDAIDYEEQACCPVLM